MAFLRNTYLVLSAVLSMAVLAIALKDFPSRPFTSLSWFEDFLEKHMTWRLALWWPGVVCSVMLISA